MPTISSPLVTVPPARPHGLRQVERADEILAERAARLGRNWPRSKDGVTVMSAVSFADPRTHALSLEVEATVSPHVAIGVDKAQRLVGELTEPILAAARQQICDELGTAPPIAVHVRLTHTVDLRLHAPAAARRLRPASAASLR